LQVVENRRQISHVFQTPPPSSPSENPQQNRVLKEALTKHISCQSEGNFRLMAGLPATRILSESGPWLRF
jgi:hypothetical protein